jgi:hypothetical protein
MQILGFIVTSAGEEAMYPLAQLRKTGVSTGTRHGNDAVASFEVFLDELAAAFVRVSAPNVDGEIELARSHVHLNDDLPSSVGGHDPGALHRRPTA